MSLQVAIGEMKQVGTLRKNNPVANTTGGQYDGYTDVLTCRGRFRQRSANKSLEQGDIVQNKSFEWVVRWQGAIVIDVDSAWVIGGVYYRIASWEKVDQVPHFYRFILNTFQ